MTCAIATSGRAEADDRPADHRAPVPAAPAQRRGLSKSTIDGDRRALAVVLVVSAAREISDNSNLTSAGTFGVMVRTAAPLALAGLAGLFAERSGTVNIGLEGMMVMGTIFAGWWGWEMGPWMAIVGGIFGGLLGGMLHAMATATFGVNHIVSGFAINIIAPGVARFIAGLVFVDRDRRRHRGRLDHQLAGHQQPDRAVHAAAGVGRRPLRLDDTGSAGAGWRTSGGSSCPTSPGSSTA